MITYINNNPATKARTHASYILYSPCRGSDPNRAHHPSPSVRGGIAPKRSKLNTPMAGRLRLGNHSARRRSLAYLFFFISTFGTEACCCWLLLRDVEDRHGEKEGIVYWIHRLVHMEWVIKLQYVWMNGARDDWWFDVYRTVLYCIVSTVVVLTYVSCILG